MGIPAREIEWAVSDSDCECIVDGRGFSVCDAVRQARTGWKRRRGAGGGVFHTAEAGTGRRTGAAVFLLYHAAAGNLVYRWFVHCGFVRSGAEELAGPGNEPGNVRLHDMALLSASEF